MAFIGSAVTSSSSWTATSSRSTCTSSNAAVIIMSDHKGSKFAGFRDDFLPQVGTRGAGSKPKFDMRPNSLRPDMLYCDCCKGTGVTTCSICEGVPIMKMDGTEMKCPACKGTNKVACGACRQTGKTPELTTGWENLLGKFNFGRN
eukprot:CAMPEP_0184692008 /NCGR_PEP_ID=MMETSP0313-20130426/660_1 /TAXON_ID=2792 /ORGANISM="Porphyridium aerugineum, Strain SAG 1380-2" /LENGTH=145 /DNA_ID=CAMNT_0027149803 /DNA_START=199 /DNA_END=636 /DNA_ORIENTATION=-